MANAMRKMAKYLGLVDTEELHDESIDSVDRPTEVIRRPVEVSRPLAPVTQSHMSQSHMSQSHASQSHVVEMPAMNKIVTLHPRNYNEAKTVGEHYRSGVPVIMNLTDMNDVDAKRLVDFGAGLVFGLHGTIERVTAKVFLLSPANVIVSMEEKSAAAEASFFNQS
jgi:cell division inhibitor SepF